MTATAMTPIAAPMMANTTLMSEPPADVPLLPEVLDAVELEDTPAVPLVPEADLDDVPAVVPVVELVVLLVVVVVEPVLVPLEELVVVEDALLPLDVVEPPQTDAQSTPNGQAPSTLT